VISGMLRRLWRSPLTPHPFRPLSTLTEYWTKETLGQIEQWPDVGLVREGLQLFEELPRNATRKVLLATDLHAGNVVWAEREPWLVIDPKPFVGDPAYDTTQHLFNCPGRLRLDPDRKSEVLQTWLESNTNAPGSGCSPAQRRDRATIRAMAIWCRSQDQLLRRARVLIVNRFAAGRVQANRSFLERRQIGSDPVPFR
jgi:hypothetical protein